MIVVIFIAIAIIVLILGINSKAEVTVKSRDQKITELLKSCREDSKKWQDQLYESIKLQHSNKTLEEIQEYIKSHQHNNDPYWARNGMEYKILMDRTRELQKIKDEEMRNLLSSDKIYSFTYNDLFYYYRLISYNQHIYGDIDLAQIKKVLDNLSFEKFSPLLLDKKPGSAVRWLNARKNEGEYISEKLEFKASEIDESESLDDVFKRKKKNLQNNLSKARKEGNNIRIESIQKQLDELVKL